jgi:hypothetical protein
MIHYSKYEDVYFIEESINNVNIIQHIETEINQFFGQSQLKSLPDVKKKMYDIIKKYNGNAIINFKYGQRSTFWKSIFGLDDVLWYGSGDVVLLSDKNIRDLTDNNL